MSRSVLRLARLRRLPVMAAFLLAVFLVRVGIGMACEPHEFAELFGGTSPPAAMAANDDQGGGTAVDHGPDHCWQCQCHHGIAMPSATGTLTPSPARLAASFLVVPHADAPPGRQLRPPIV